MINLSQWKRYIVVPTLTQFAALAKIPVLAAPWAINQIVGTTKESNGCEYVMQLDDGPAVGFYQMEPATHDDIWINYLAYQPLMAQAIRTACATDDLGAGFADVMMGDLVYATLMCRICYYRSRLSAPANTAESLAQYHKIVYNTMLGASVAADDVAYYQLAINA